MNMLSNYKKINSYIYEIFLVLIVISHYIGILHTNSFLAGADISDFVALKSDTIQTATLKSARLPVYYLFEFLYNGLGLSNEFIKAALSFFSLSVIVFSIYKITIYVFNNKLGGILAVILFLYSSLYFSVLFSNVNFIDDANPDALSYSFLMLGIFYWLRERFKISTIFMGLSFDCHPILPIGFLTVFFTHQLINYKRIKLKNIVASLLLFLVVTSPVIYSVITTSVGTITSIITQKIDSELVWKYVKFAQPQSAFINIIPGFNYGLSLYFSSFLLLLLLYQQGDKVQKEKYFKLFLLVFTVFAFTIFELLNSYYFKIIPLYNLWMHRFMCYGSVTAYIVIAGSAFYTMPENKASSFLRICLFLLLCFSIFAQELDADLYMTFWAGHFYILEIVLIYYLYNMGLSLFKNKISFKALALHLVFVSWTLVYYYYIALYDRFNPNQAFFYMFDLENFKLFLEMIFYRQFKYAWVYDFYQGFFILSACLLCFAIAYLLKSGAGEIVQNNFKGRKVLRYAVVSILTGALSFNLWAVAEKSSLFNRRELFLSTYAMWTMDDIVKNTVKDSKGEHHAVSFNTSVTEGHSGKALYFNGRDSYIKTPVSFKGWLGVTLAMWVRPEPKTEKGLSVILDNGHNAKNDFVVQSADIDNPRSDSWVFHCNGVDIPLIIPFKQWSHIVVVANAKKGIVQAYINGVNAGKWKTEVPFEFGAKLLSIGKLTTEDARYFKGSIDEVIILNKAVDKWNEYK